MPQLDIISFFSQLFWLFIVFTFFYFMFFEYVVPVFGRIIKIRKKKLNKSLLIQEKLLSEIQMVSVSYDSIIKASCLDCSFFFNKGFSQIATWLAFTQGKTLSKIILSANYIQIFAKMKRLQIILVNVLFF